MIHKLIDTTTATHPTGLPTQRRLFKVTSGPFAERLIALFATAPTSLSLSYADPPYSSWLDPAVIVTDSADTPFSAAMDRNFNVYLAYTQQSSDALMVVKLVFANGVWAVQTPATAYDSATSTNTRPSLLKDAYDRIWVAWTRDDGGVVTVRSKLSTDDAQSFGSGPTDAGDNLSGSTTAGTALLIARANDIHCIYTVGSSTIKNRDRDLDAGLWNPEDTLYTGTGLGSEFHAAVAADGMLGVLFVADGRLFLKEYDGATWGALQTVGADPVTAPSLHYRGTAPSARFLQSIGTDQNRLMETIRDSGTFPAATPVLSQFSTWATVFLFDKDAGEPYAELTGETMDSGGADVLHPTSGALLAETGDAVYVGSEDRFSFIRVTLSTPGVSGTVEWSYWNGVSWFVFTPGSGVAHFTQANAGVRLFADGVAIPVDWQRGSVNGINLFWIRAVVTSDYTTPPIGSQLTPVPNTSSVVTHQTV